MGGISGKKRGKIMITIRLKDGKELHFENEVTNRLIYLFIIDLEDDSVLCTPRFKNSKLWNFKQIEENLGKGFFSCCFEDEYEHLKNVIYIREKYKES